MPSFVCCNHRVHLRPASVGESLEAYIFLTGACIVLWALLALLFVCLLAWGGGRGGCTAMVQEWQVCVCMCSVDHLIRREHTLGKIKVGDPCQFFKREAFGKVNETKLWQLNDLPLQIHTWESCMRKRRRAIGGANTRTKCFKTTNRKKKSNEKG